MLRRLAQALAVNRTLFGLGYLARPGDTASNWVGEVAEDEAAQVLARALVARDRLSSQNFAFATAMAGGSAAIAIAATIGLED